MADNSRELILAQNQFAFVQEEAKGGVSVWVGPSKQGLTPSDKPVVYDPKTTKFRAVSLDEAISQFVFAAEGSYVVVENPTNNNKHPERGSNPQANLEVGRKINMHGPATFPLWPGEVATVIEGHHLRSNQYLFVRIYNPEDAKLTLKEGDKPYTTGQQLVIKGTECSFYIPPNGFEVLKDTNGGSYVREALTLERLEYCILLHENGTKRYEKGPQVVFPEATEKFVAKNVGEGENREKSFKFKAIELDDQMGLYIKVIADYEEETSERYKNVTELPEGFKGDYHIDERTKEVFVTRKYKTGEELFITGAEQRIYYPRAEHALIQYPDPTKKFNRDKYYGIAVPKGEARYVLDKTNGKVESVQGPQIFLPDPRKQVVVRRVLDRKTVELWYPGNTEALQYNDNLRSLMTNSLNYVAEAQLSATNMEATRSINRMTKGSAAMVGSFQGDTLNRGSDYTPPRTITLDTKYDGVPLITVWTGYAVQMVNKSGQRRVVTGPASLLLEYDETLEVMELSSGKPKTTDNLKRTVYLRTEANKVSDIVEIETKDLVRVSIKLSYRVNFEGENKRWYNVENYTKFLCDHLRSLLRAKGKEFTIERFVEEGATIVRDTVLGKSVEGSKRPGKSFEENGMRVYDVEVLNVTIQDSKVASLLLSAQTETVEHTIKMQVAKRRLEMLKQEKKNEIEIAQAQAEVDRESNSIEAAKQKDEHELELGKVRHSIQLALEEAEGEKDRQDALDVVAERELAREKAVNEETISVSTKEAELVINKMKAMDDKLLPAIQNLIESEWAAGLEKAILPLAVIEQESPANVLKRFLTGTPLARLVENTNKLAAKAGSNS
jgi:major vault protein